MYEITQEQKEAIAIAIEVFNKVAEVIRKAIDYIKEFFNNFITYVMRLQPKQRYKFLKRMGVKNYILFFHRN